MSAYTVQRKSANKEFLEREFGRTCAHCGKEIAESREICYHHIDPKTKSFTIKGNGALKNSREVLIAEMKKCVILCFSCHSRHHARERWAAGGKGAFGK